MLSQAGRFKNGLVIFAERIKVRLFEGIHFEYAIEEFVLRLERFVDAHLRARAHEFSEGQIEIPGMEGKFIRFRVEVDIEILAHHQNAVPIGEPNSSGHEAGEFVDVEVAGQALGEVVAGCGGHEFREFNDALFLFPGQRGFGIVHLIVFVPIVSQVAKQAAGRRLEDGAFGLIEALFGEGFVNIFDN